MFVGGNYTIDPSFGAKSLDSSKTTGILDFSEVSGAAAEDAIIHAPTRSLYDLVEGANLFGEDEGKRLSKVDIGLRANEQFYAKFMKVPDEGMTEREYDILYEDIRAEKLREFAFMRAPDTVGQYVSTLGVSLLVSMVDPTSIAIGYMPMAAARAGYIGVKAANLAKKYDDTLDTLEAGGRAAERAKAGAVGGVFEGAVTEVPVYFAANNRQEKYGATDVFNSIAFGAVVGTGIQVSGGALYDLATVTSRAAKRKQIATTKEMEATEKLRIQKTVGPIRPTIEEPLPDGAAFTGPLSMEQLEDKLMRGFLKSGVNSQVQRDLANYTIEERSALMQAGLAQFVSGKNILGTDFVKTFEARRLGERYKPEDVSAVTAEVIDEKILQEIEFKSKTRVSPDLERLFADNTNALRNEIAELEKQVNVQVKKGTSLKKRNEIIEKSDLLDAKKRELEQHRAAFKAREQQGKGARERLKAVKAGDYPTDLKRGIDAEVARRMAIIDEVHLPRSPRYQFGPRTKTSSIVSNYLKDIKIKTEAPSAQRSYRADAEATMSSTGKRQQPSEEMTAIAQQAVDATENAMKLADDNNLKYSPSKGIETMLGDIEQMKTSAQKLAVCMSKPL